MRRVCVSATSAIADTMTQKDGWTGANLSGFFLRLFVLQPYSTRPRVEKKKPGGIFALSQNRRIDRFGRSRSSGHLSFDRVVTGWVMQERWTSDLTDLQPNDHA